MLKVKFKKKKLNEQLDMFWKLEKLVSKIIEFPIFVNIEHTPPQAYISFTNEDEEPSPIVDGGITLYESDETEAMVIEYSNVDEGRMGIGPILYEVCLEYASMISGGLTPDRETVSPAAQAVWDIYNVRKDVFKQQMDVDLDAANDTYGRGFSKAEPSAYIKQTTPNDPEDDITQDMSLELAGFEKFIQSDVEPNKQFDKWVDTSLSKVYYKKDYPFMKLLMANGRLQLPEELKAKL